MSDIGKIIVGAVEVVVGIATGRIDLITAGGTLILSGTIGLITKSMVPKASQSQERSKINVRFAEPIRLIVAGHNLIGGAALFGEFDSAGNFWYIIVHSDSLVTNPSGIVYYLDNQIVSVNAGTHEVLNADYRLIHKAHDPVTVDGQGDAYVWLWTTTYTESDPTPPGIADLIAAFPGKWTVDHKLVGTTYTVCKMRALKAEDRYKIYKWRGPFQMGEPGISILADWSHVYDPRDGTQTNGVPSTYKFTRNPVLLWAWFRTHRYGRNKPRTSINWDMVAAQANICDETVSGLVGTHTRYMCDIVLPEDVTRSDCEQMILATMDAQLVFDDDGKVWPRAGYYYAPTLALTRRRDIFSMASAEAQNGESEVQGVIVRYTDPLAGYVTQPAAPWYNPLYYVPGEATNFMEIDILGCQDHNQAMRLAKAMGMRLQPRHVLAPTVSLRGIKARQERVINLEYDTTFTGDYEIATPVKIDRTGIVCSFNVVPVDADRWTLLAGEEKPRPVVDSVGTVTTPALPSGVSLSYADGRIIATYTNSAREDIGYEFQFIVTSDISTDNWLGMFLDPIQSRAYTDVILPDVPYSVRYRSVSASGRVSDWSTPYLTFLYTSLSTTEPLSTEAGDLLTTEDGYGLST